MSGIVGPDNVGRSEPIQIPGWSVLGDLGPRTSHGRANELCAQVYAGAASAPTWRTDLTAEEDLRSFLKRAQAGLGAEIVGDDTERMARAVLDTIASAIAAGCADELKAELPEGFMPASGTRSDSAEEEREA